MITKTTLYEQAARQILGEIEKGVYQKGDMLPGEIELALSLSVSRVTIRQALKTLAQTGIIATYKGKGSVVLVDPKMLREEDVERFQTDFMESTEARLLLEPEIAKEAARRATAEDIQKLEKTLPGRGRYLPGRMDDFHMTLAGILRNPWITQLLGQMIEAETHMNAKAQLEVVVPERQQTVVEEIRSQHEKIFEAVKNGNGEFAYFYMKEHLLFLKQSYEEYFSIFKEGDK